MLDALRLARESLHQRARDLVDERRRAERDLGRDAEIGVRDLLEVGAHDLEIVGNREESREHRFLALLQRRMASRHQQEDPRERGFGVERGIPRLDLHLFEIGAHCAEAGAQQSEVHALLDRQLLPGNGRDQALLEIPQPRDAFADRNRGCRRGSPAPDGAACTARRTPRSAR